MKNFKLILTLALCFTFGASYGQFKVYTSGDCNVGEARPSGAINLYTGQNRVADGNAFLRLVGDAAAYPNGGFYLQRTGTGSSRFYHLGTGQYQFRAEQASDITFWTAATNRMKVGSDGALTLNSADAYKTGGGMWTAPSDSRLKTDVADYDQGLEQIMQIRPVYYTYTEELHKGASSSEQVGVIAQELQQVSSRMVNNFQLTDDEGAQKGSYLSVDPSDFIYMLINATQTQQEELEAKDAVITDLEERLAKIEATLERFGSNGASQSINVTAATLAQNAPNPFNQSTRITYAVPTNAANATLQVFDLNGQLLKSVNVAKGNGEVTLNANELAAGTYSYALVVDGVTVDSKKMVLTK